MDEIISKRFSKWTVIGPLSRDKYSNKRIVCRCDCGKKQKVLVYNLKEGISKKCQVCFHRDRIKSIVGMKFGHYMVLEDAGRAKYGVFLVRCQCDCGIIKIVQKAALISRGLTRCRRCAFVKHNMSGTPIYRVREAMLARCYNKKDNSYCNHGGRGIAVCDRWKESFENFYADMGDRPKGYQIGRIDNNSNYEPGNCRWDTAKVNLNNRRKVTK